MELNKEALRLLKLANKRPEVNFEDPAVYSGIKGSPHQAYLFEQIGYLSELGYVTINSVFHREEGFEESTFRITPEGQSALVARRRQITDIWITRAIALVSLVISIIALLKQ